MAQEAAAPGQAEFFANGSAGSNIHSLIVPAGVTAMSMLVLSSRRELVCKISRSGVDLIRSDQPIGSGDRGGGNGGGISRDPVNPAAFYGGAGGAGGYDGPGGDGGGYSTAAYSASPGNTGGGGGGGGGCGSYGTTNQQGQPTGVVNGRRGGGVGIRGKGSDGGGGGPGFDAGGYFTTPGQPGSTEGGQPFLGAGDIGQTGGNLRWVNNISVSPGDTLNIDLGDIAYQPSVYVGAAARILWGAGRSYPNNAA